MRSLLRFKDRKSEDTLKITLLTSLFTIIAAVSSISLQNYFTVVASQNESLRIQQRTTYLAYSDAYNSYRYATNNYRSCIVDKAHKEGIDINKSNNYKILAEIGSTECPTSRIIETRFDYQDAVNKMHLDGSSRAVRLIKALSVFVPTSLGNLSDENGLPPIQDIMSFRLNTKGKTENTVYELFLDQTCRDVRPTDKEVCEEFSAGRE